MYRIDSLVRKNSYAQSTLDLLNEYLTKDGLFLYPSLSSYNENLEKNRIVSFNLPSGITCPGANIAADDREIYSRFISDSAKISEVINLISAVKLDSFVESMVTEIRTRGQGSIVRWHERGDVFDQEYLDALTEVMKSCRDVHFYTYTKSLNLSWCYAERLQNFRKIQSLGGKFDALVDWDAPVAKTFSSREDMARTCYQDASESDLIAAFGAQRVGLIRHDVDSHRIKRVA